MGVELQVASLILGLGAAQQQRKAAELEAQAYAEQKEMAEIEAGQQENARNRQLRIQLASLATSMSGQGVAISTSGSMGALASDEIRIAGSDVEAIRLMGQSNKRRYALSEASAKTSAKAATIGGFTKAAGIGYDIYKGVG